MTYCNVFIFKDSSNSMDNMLDPKLGLTLPLVTYQVGASHGSGTSSGPSIKGGPPTYFTERL